MFQYTSYGWWGGEPEDKSATLPEAPPPMHMCEECAGSAPLPQYGGKTYFEEMGLPNEPTVYDLLAKNWGYLGFTHQAYSFVNAAVEEAFREARSKLPENEGCVVGGPQIAEAFRKLGFRDFGANALSTLNGWGIHGCEDIGTIISHMVLFRIFAPNPDGEPDDFSGLYDFETAFPTTPT